MSERAVRLLVAAVVLGTPLAVYGVRWALARTEPGVGKEVQTSMGALSAETPPAARARATRR